MVKRSKAERVASAGARVGGRGIGAALSSPFGLGALGLGALLIGVFIFRDRISEFFNRLPSQIAGGLGDININLPSIELPDITFPDLPALPELPDFASIFQNFFNQQQDISGETFEQNGATGMFGEDTTIDTGTGIIEGETPPTVDLDVGTGLDPLGEISFNQLRSRVFDTLTNLGLTPAEAFGRLRGITFQEGGFRALDDLLQSFNTPFTPPDQPDQALGFDDTVLNLIGTSQEFLGGGVGFQGGVINPTPITTLTQVLDLFPNLTASQAADFLGEFSGILPEAALLQGGDVINISGDPNQPQTFNQSSLGISGTPEELFKLLFPTIISNF